MDLQDALERTELHGFASLSDEELLAIVLAGDLGDARGLLARSGGLRPLARWSAAEIAAVGVGAKRGTALAAAIELGRRTAHERTPKGKLLTSSTAVFKHFRAAVRDERREVFLAILLDVKLKVLRDVRISEGSLAMTLVHPREAFAPAVRESAHAVIFAHNHPSGDPAPSDDDVSLTRRLVAAGDVLGIKVHDHVICGADALYSFADEGRLR